MKQNPAAFQFSSVKTYDLCLQAVKFSGLNLEFVPNEYKTHEMIMTALKSNGWAIKFIDNQTEEYALEAVLQNTETSLEVNEEIRNSNKCISEVYKEVRKRLPF